VTSCAFQVVRAQELAVQRQLGSQCSFVIADFVQAPAGPFDVVFAIESFGHADDLVAALRAVRSRLAPGGRLLWVDDLRGEPDDGDGDADVQELARCWSSPPLRTVAAAKAALAAAGLHLLREVDLTDRVPFLPLAKNRRRARWLRGLGAIVPLARPRTVLRAFVGGLALERLYARGACRYLVWMAGAAPNA
jgi:SAM-dependent methyltransferase